jgi:hypothetical protein
MNLLLIQADILNSPLLFCGRDIPNLGAGTQFPYMTSLSEIVF